MTEFLACGLQQTPYPEHYRKLLSAKGACGIRADISLWPGYAPTPLHSLSTLASDLGLATLWYKDESRRFQLKSFKALGGAFAVDRLMQRTAVDQRGSSVRDLVVCCATDGNHGRSVAWGAARHGLRCVIYLHAGVSPGRETALRDLGAEIVRVEGNYDASVHAVRTAAAEKGWEIVADTAESDQELAPLDVMRGYTVMTDEILDQLSGQRPTHVLIQGGVGGLAAAVFGHLWDAYDSNRPHFAVVEPDRAACLLESARAGVPVAVTGDLDTIMAGLACGEVSQLAWPIIRDCTDTFVAVGDRGVGPAVRRLAAEGIEAGESAVAGLCALQASIGDAELRSAMNLGPDSRVLLIGTEGATDPVIYRRLLEEG